MGWWDRFVERVRGAVGQKNSLTPAERAVLGEPLVIEAQDVAIETPLGSASVPLIARAAGRTKCVLRLRGPIRGREAEPLLRTVAAIHWALPDVEVCLLGSGP